MPISRLTRLASRYDVAGVGASEVSLARSVVPFG